MPVATGPTWTAGSNRIREAFTCYPEIHDLLCYIQFFVKKYRITCLVTNELVYSIRKKSYTWHSKKP